jgi:uncharacterized membrane protein
LTETIAGRWNADRPLALLGYGLLFVAVFFAGVTGPVAALIAYAVRDRATPDVRRHFDRQIGIFWIAVALGVLATAAGVAAVVVLLNSGMLLTVDDGIRLDAGENEPGAWFVGLVGASIVIWLATAIWLLCASGLGFIRLATSDIGA